MPARTSLSVRRGDGESAEELLADLFDREYLKLCRFATLLLGDPGRAEDTVQEAFLRTFASWGRLRDPARANAYLWTAVVNLSRSRLRRRRSERRGNEAVWWRDSARSGILTGERDAAVLTVLDAVQSLPPRQREAVVLHYLTDLAEHDVAATMGCSVGTVKSQLSKARATLARVLEEPIDD
ncbi:MAG: SigE family RNA polymerase sigma factor [Acidimicrobiales bacterium]